MTNPTASRLVRDQRGFTLAELLIATFLTLMVSALSLQALQQANRTTEAVMAMSDVNQNLRVALNVLIRDLLSTGEGIPIGGVAFPNGGTAVARPAPPSLSWTFESGWATLPAVIPGDGIGPTINTVATDAVTLLIADRRLNFANVNVTGIPNNGSSVTVPNTVNIGTPTATAVVAGDLIMLTNANGSTIQEVTSVSGQVINFATSAASHLNQPTAPDGSIVDIRNPAGSGTTWPPTQITRVNMISYYIYVPTSGQITSPHLIRRINYGEARVVAIGITNLQLTWDLVDGVNNPTSVPNPGSGGNTNTEHQIRNANLFLAARSLQKTAQTGQYTYSSLSTNVSLRSLSLVSRYDLQ